MLPDINYIFIVLFPKTLLFAKGVRSQYASTCIQVFLIINRIPLAFVDDFTCREARECKHHCGHLWTRPSLSRHNYTREIRMEGGDLYSHGSYKYWIIVRRNSPVYVIIASIIVRDAITMLFVPIIFCFDFFSITISVCTWIGFDLFRFYTFLHFGDVSIIVWCVVCLWKFFSS